jgi:hypothetical protein
MNADPKHYLKEPVAESRSAQKGPGNNIQEQAKLQEGGNNGTFWLKYSMLYKILKYPELKKKIKFLSFRQKNYVK